MVKRNNHTRGMDHPEETQGEASYGELVTLPRYQLYLLFEHLCGVANALESITQQGAANTDALDTVLDALDRIIDQVASTFMPEP